MVVGLFNFFFYKFNLRAIILLSIAIREKHYG